MTDQHVYCEQSHPGGDFEAEQWCRNYHSPRLPLVAAHLINTDHDAHGRYWAWCDCNWYTLPAYDSAAAARVAGQDHLNEMR